MNTTAPFGTGTPALRLPRRTSAATEPVAAETTAPETQSDDFDAFREREANLRAYEEKLRAWQTQLDAQAAQLTAAPAPASGGSTAPFLRPSSQNPFAGDPALQAAWEKFHRARALMEAEQNQLRDDRMALRDMDADLKRREAALADREARVVAQEQQQAAAAATPVPEPEAARSTMQRLTQAPFLAAKAVFRSGK